MFFDDIYRKYLDKKFKNVNLKDKLDSFKAAITPVKEQLKAQLIKECNNIPVSAKDILNLAKRVPEENRINANITKFSSSEIKARKELHEKAVTVFADNLTDKIEKKKMFDVFCKNDSVRADRIASNTIISFAKNTDELNNVTKWINNPTPENKKNLERFITNGVKKTMETLDYLSSPHSDKELLEYMSVNHGSFEAAAEFQGDNLSKCAQKLGITLPDSLTKDYEKYKQIGVDMQKLKMKVNNMANPYFPEIAPEDVENIFSPILNSMEAMESEKDNLLIETIVEDPSDVGEYEFSPFKMYNANCGQMAYVKHRSEMFKAISDPDLSPEENEKAAKKAEINIYETDMNIFEENLKFKMNKNFGIKDYIFKIDGQTVDREKALLSAVKGERIQIFSAGKNTEEQEFLMNAVTNDIQDNGLCEDLAHPVKFGLDKIAENGSDNPEKESLDKIKEGMRTLYDELKKGSRWYISSKGLYGQVMKQISDISKLTTIDDKSIEKINKIKEDAQDYLTTRATKTNRNKTELQRENVMEKVFQSVYSLGTQMEKVKELSNNLNKEASKEEDSLDGKRLVDVDLTFKDKVALFNNFDPTKSNAEKQISQFKESKKDVSTPDITIGKK